MDWIEATVYTTSEAIEAVSGFLYELGITGLIIKDNLDMENFINNNDKTWDYIDENLFNEFNEESYIKFYISNNIQGKEKLSLVANSILQLKQLANEINFGTLEIKLTNVSEEDWSNNWKKYYKPLRIGERIVIKPTWEEFIPQKNDLIIEIDPGMAFGTGTHETTSMCIELLQKYIKNNDIVLDIGCGSGILSITAAILGADKVVGVDFDLNSVVVAKKNVEKNNLINKITILDGDLMDVINEKGNIIVANIIADVIIKLSLDVPKFSLPNALFICSGIIKERLNDVKFALSNNFDVIEIVTKGEWVAMVAQIKR